MGAAGATWYMFSAPAVHRLALPADLVDASSASGRALLANAIAKTDYEQLVPEFVVQERPTFCGVASGVAVINAILHPQPRLTQLTLFSPEAAAVRSELAVTFVGLTLDQLAQLIQAHGLRVETRHVSQSSLEAFRGLVRTTLAEPKAFVLVNYDRRRLGQEGTGHISPLAAYNSERDVVLILDVAAYKYPYTWVPLTKLWDAIATKDPMSGQTRGYLVVSAGQLASH